ncbi:MAG: cytochrome oxidase [Dokdonella sp.]|nr:MAG: cytochrome oxidase [Dokdonella sp.]
MIFQDLVWTIAASGIALVALVFLYIVANAGRAIDPAALGTSQRRIAGLRRGLFWVLVLVFVGASYASLHRFPIPPQHAPLDAAQVVDVQARQWSWQLSQPGQPPGAALQLTAGTPVEFRVRSDDVNHGFAIYAPNGRIAIQTQAMPGFTNKILHTFTQAGTYRVMCLEYCGLGHAPMVSSFDVAVPAGG